MKPRLLDLFCKAGGCTKGYQMAGFEVIGVDIEPQPRYIGDGFILGDALDILQRLIDGEGIEDNNGRAWRLSDFIVIHASPPCQAYSEAAKQWRARGKKYPRLVKPVRELLLKTRIPYVLENVPESGLIDPLVLNGAFFGKNLRRTRHFETSCTLPFVLLPKEGPSGFRMGRKPKSDDPVVPVGHFSGVEKARRVMGVPWMTQGEIAQAIPPAYTEYIGRQMLAALGEAS